MSGVADLVGRVLAGRYRLVAPIGAGSSGRVYVADDVRLRRRVAVKVLHAALAEDASFLRRFRAEAQLAASLSHPNVMAVFDWGEDGNLPFMVLELLPGGSLRSMLDAGTRLTPQQAALVGGQVASALQYAHGRGLIHRDVKPANLLFDEHATVRVADFGLARALAEASWTEPAGTLVGTARYAAPEQASGGPLDGRADLYSLAVVLVEAVTGEVPIVGDTAVATLLARVARGIEAPPEVGRLGPVLERAGRPDPADRYPDAATMGAALADAAAAMPPPEPLALAGLGELSADDEPTRIPSAGTATVEVFDQDAEARPSPPVVVRGRTGGRRSAVPVVVGLALVAALGAAAVAFLSAGGGGTVAAPRLVGLTRELAASRASDAGVLMKVRERTADDPAGVVIEQSPTPGKFVDDGSTVRVVVSRGPPPVPVPDVAGRDAASAQQLLAEATFAVTLDRRYDENVAKGVAIGTEPGGGASAPRESTVTLVVSDGPAPVPVPDVTGKTYDEAAAALASARLQAVRAEEFSDTVEAGKVIRTDPVGGRPAARDSQVTVVVSKGPELVAVPGLVGQTVEAASQTLTAAGLVPTVENYGPGKRVRAQDPAAGTTVKKGSKVTLFL